MFGRFDTIAVLTAAGLKGAVVGDHRAPASDRSSRRSIAERRDHRRRVPSPRPGPFACLRRPPECVRRLKGLAQHCRADRARRDGDWGRYPRESGRSGGGRGADRGLQSKLRPRRPCEPREQGTKRTPRSFFPSIQSASRAQAPRESSLQINAFALADPLVSTCRPSGAGACHLIGAAGNER
jgi:hypothetical protein